MKNKNLIIGGVAVLVLVLGAVAFILLSGDSKNSSSEGISLEEVAMHNSKASCWMAIEGDVYDVTDYVNSHPGGNFILDGCGKEATDLFNGSSDDSARSTDHSNTAKGILEQYKIGTLTD